MFTLLCHIEYMYLAWFRYQCKVCRVSVISFGSLVVNPLHMYEGYGSLFVCLCYHYMSCAVCLNA